MPQISRFFGIVIYMYFNDHAPPHFHAEYAGDEAVYTIETLETLRGQLPRRAHSMVVEWASLNRYELMDNWHRARRMEALEQIDPLD
ncbi:MAG: DUF4160 domain-containing protein [Ardenticatenaceae bacterium]|nr:DUF4160 domain-containing protein [Ardenticatenaceae bacterium]